MTEFRIQNTEGRSQKSEVRSQKSENEDKKLKKLTSEFESVFLYYMIKTMRDTVTKSGFISGKSGEEIYKSMMDQELAKSMAERGKSEISETMYKQLNKK
ncbi:MAG: rod-binding protein [Nitrospinae bacterium]|nr:rod-binding protein [Nitrospinota bacterium]